MLTNAANLCRRGGGFAPFASSWGHNLQHVAGWSVTEMTWLKEELPKHLRFHCSCCRIRRNHRRRGMVTLGHDRIWHRPQQMLREEFGNRGNTRKPCAPSTLPPVSPHLQLRAIASSGLPRKDKAEIVPPTDVVLWPAPHLCSIQKTQSHLGRGSPGNGCSLFPTQKPPWLQETSPEGFKALCNYWVLQCNYQHQDSAKYSAQFLGIQDLYWKYPKSSQSCHLPLLTTVFQAPTATSHSTFLSVRGRYCSALSEQL